MPIYEYHCPNCQETFEILTSSSKDEKPCKCPKCGSQEIKKNISASSIRVGSGQLPACGMPAGCGGKSGFS